MLAARSDAPRRARRERDEAIRSVPRIAPYVKCSLWMAANCANRGLDGAASAYGGARNDLARPGIRAEDEARCPAIRRAGRPVRARERLRERGREGVAAARARLLPL